MTSGSRAAELVRAVGKLPSPSQEGASVAGPSRLPLTSARHAHSSSHSGYASEKRASQTSTEEPTDKELAPAKEQLHKAILQLHAHPRKVPARNAPTQHHDDAAEGSRPQWWNASFASSSRNPSLSLEALDRQLAAVEWPFGASRPEELYRDAYVAHPDRYDWRKSCGTTPQVASRQASSARPLQRRRASASMVMGQESKIAAKSRRTAERKMDDRSLRISREKAAQLLSRNAEREPIRQEAKLYRDKWTELLNHERTQEHAAIAERRKAPIERLIDEGIAIDGLQAYWQDDSKRHFGKRTAVFKLDAAEPLPVLSSAQETKSPSCPRTLLH